jgi:hypothetical protein
MIPQGIGERQNMPVLDESVLRSEVDARPRQDGRCVRQGYAVVPTPSIDDVGVGKKPLPVDDRPNLVGGSTGTKRVDDRCTERCQALPELVQDTAKVDWLRHRALRGRLVARA